MKLPAFFELRSQVVQLVIRQPLIRVVRLFFAVQPPVIQPLLSLQLCYSVALNLA